MSRHRYGWYPVVHKIIEYSLDENNVPCSPLDYCYFDSVNKAISRISKMQDGTSRIAFIAMVYKNKTHTIAGAGMKLHISERTAERWSRNFIYTVAEELNYLPKNGGTQPRS